MREEKRKKGKSFEEKLQTKIEQKILNQMGNAIVGTNKKSNDSGFSFLKMMMLMKMMSKQK